VKIMNHSADQQFLHVANGTSTTDSIRAAGIPGTCSIWADPLYEGPVPAGVTDAELIAVRARFLAGPDPADADPVDDLRRWRAVIDRHDSYDELILWYEHDLFDQLNLIQVLSWIRERLPAGQPVSLVCIGAFPNRPAFKGLGELTPGDLAALLDTRQPVSAAQYALAGRAWEAFRQPDPGPLDALRRSDTAALPFLAPAIERFLQEYPWTTDGLSRSERRLLRLAEPGGIDLRSAFPRMHDDEQAYYVTDCSLASLAETLSGSSPPLLTRGPGSGGGILQGSVTLTETGRAVLAGQRDRVETCGIDRWLGGVHLQGDAAAWRWDENRRSIVGR
jgi:hypothetical protein